MNTTIIKVKEFICQNIIICNLEWRQVAIRNVACGDIPEGRGDCTNGRPFIKSLTHYRGLPFKPRTCSKGKLQVNVFLYSSFTLHLSFYLKIKQKNALNICSSQKVEE